MTPPPLKSGRCDFGPEVVGFFLLLTFHFSLPLAASELSETLNDTAQTIEDAASDPAGRMSEIETLYKDCVSLYEEMKKASGVGEEEKKAFVRLETAWKELRALPGPTPYPQPTQSTQPSLAAPPTLKITEEDLRRFLEASDLSLSRLRQAISEDAAAMTREFKKMEEKKLQPAEAKKTILPNARHFLARGYRRFISAQAITDEVALQCKNSGLNSPKLKKSLEKMLLQAGKIDNTIKNASALYAYYSKRLGETK